MDSRIYGRAGCGCVGDAGALVLRPCGAAAGLWNGGPFHETAEPASGQHIVALQLRAAQPAGRHSAGAGPILGPTGNPLSPVSRSRRKHAEFQALIRTLRTGEGRRRLRCGCLAGPLHRAHVSTWLASGYLRGGIPPRVFHPLCPRQATTEMRDQRRDDSDLPGVSGPL